MRGQDDHVFLPGEAANLAVLLLVLHLREAVDHRLVVSAEVHHCVFADCPRQIQTVHF